MTKFISWGARPIDPNAETYVISHGLLNSADPPEAWIRDMANNIRAKDPNANVILTNWDTSNPLLYPFYAGRTSSVGGELARFLQGSGVAPAKTTLIGHSLGAQLSGAAGRDYQRITGQKIGKIVGLDPAGPLFEQQIGTEFKLDPSDASRVVGVHTSKFFGHDAAVGHLDLYPNPNAIFQPGATNAVDNHGYATTLFNELLRGKEYPGLSLNTINSNRQKGVKAVNTSGNPRDMENSFEIVHNPLFSAIGVVWDVRVNRFRWNDTKRFATRESVEYMTKKRIEKGQRKVETATNNFVTGKANFKTWQRNMAASIKNLHLEQAMLGRGGGDHMKKKDYDRVAQTIKTEKAYFKEFAKDIKAGKLSKAQIKARANMYAQRSRLSGEIAKMQNFAEQGYAMMERRLGASDRHCSECLSYAGKGKQPIGALPLPTEQCSCRANCKCSVIYFKSFGDILSDAFSSTFG